MRKRILIAALFVAATTAGFSETQVRLTGQISLDFAQRPSVKEATDAFGDNQELLMWGPGWEVIIDHISLGGNYLVNFFRDDTQDWWLDYYSEPLYVGYHLLGARSFVDPFVQVGIGSAGRVYLEDEKEPVGHDPLYLSIFPFVSGGLAVDLDGFVIGGRWAYYPTITPPPATDFDNYPLDNFQVSFFAGIAIGHRSHHRDRRRDWGDWD